MMTMMMMIVIIRDGKGVVWQQSLPEMVQDTADHPPHPFLSSSSSSPSPKSSSPPPSTSKSSSFLRNVQVVTQRVRTGEIANAHAYISSAQKFQTCRDDVLVSDIIWNPPAPSRWWWTSAPSYIWIQSNGTQKEPWPPWPRSGDRPSFWFSSRGSSMIESRYTLHTQCCCIGGKRTKLDTLEPAQGTTRSKKLKIFDSPRKDHLWLRAAQDCGGCVIHCIRWRETPWRLPYAPPIIDVSPIVQSGLKKWNYFIVRASSSRILS